MPPKMSIRYNLKIAIINTFFVILGTYFAGICVSVLVSGKTLTSKSSRDEALNPDNCNEVSCTGKQIFENSQKRPDGLPAETAGCLMPNPIFGYYNICSPGNIGLAKETTPKKSSRVFRILLVGGSQASLMTMNLERQLDKYIKDNTKQLGLTSGEVFGAAIIGGKQPMQLQTVNALLSIGYEFDAIVNVNGWNELALAGWENQISRIPPIYPRAHAPRLEIQQKILSNRSAFEQCTRLDKVLDWHPMYLTVSYWCIRNLEASILKTPNYDWLLNKFKLNWQSAFPKANHAADALRIWATSSKNTEAIATRSGIQYLEVIQPTLNIRGAKMKASRYELDLITKKDHTRKLNNLFEANYNAKATSLSGTSPKNTLDARYIFRRYTSSSFIDSVHLNDSANDILSQLIVKHIFDSSSL